MLRLITTSMIFTALTLSAAIFGFFYAWVCSTMWGLDRADPRVAISAMQAMNASVRNGVFAPAFFGTPVILMLAAGLVWVQGARKAALFFAISAGIYVLFGFALTLGVNVPMNETLARIDTPESRVLAQEIWDAYSPEWQLWNQIRTGASGVSFLVAVSAVWSFAAFRAESVDK